MDYQQQHTEEWSRPVSRREPSDYVKRRAVELWATGYLTRIRWDAEPGYDRRYLRMIAPSGSRDGVEHRVEYDAHEDAFSCSCEAGSNGNDCPHALLCGHWLGVRELPSYVDGPYRVIGVAPKRARSGEPLRTE